MAASSVMIPTIRLSERRFMQQVVQLARLMGFRDWHDQATNAPRACPRCKAPLSLPRNDPGWPDLFLLRDDVLVIAELKAQRGSLSAPQRAWLDAFKRVRRIVVATWRPSMWDEIEQTLAHEKGKKWPLDASGAAKTARTTPDTSGAREAAR